MYSLFLWFDVFLVLFAMKNVQLQSVSLERVECMVFGNELVLELPS